MPHFPIRLLDLLEAAVHRRVVNAPMRRNLMKPVAMTVCLCYRTLPDFRKYPMQRRLGRS